MLHSRKPSVVWLLVHDVNFIIFFRPDSRFNLHQFVFNVFRICSRKTTRILYKLNSTMCFFQRFNLFFLFRKKVLIAFNLWNGESLSSKNFSLLSSRESIREVPPTKKYYFSQRSDNHLSFDIAVTIWSDLAPTKLSKDFHKLTRRWGTDPL